MTTPTVNNKLLIQCVRAYEVLYSVNHPQYSNIRHKEDVWEKIAFMLGVPISVCKRSWYNLRDSYRRALRKRRDALNDGLPYRKWRYEDEMEFMAMHVTIRDPTERTDADDILGAEGESREAKYQPEGDPEDPLFTPREQIGRARRATNPSKRRRYDADAVNPDHIDGFLIGIGATLRNFTRRYQNLAKGRIFNVVSELEMEQIMEFKEDSEKERGQNGSQKDSDKPNQEQEVDESEYEEIRSPTVVLEEADSANQSESAPNPSDFTPPS